MLPPFEEFVERFNAADYRSCVEPLEALWFEQRDDFHKGLIRLCVGLHQLRLGLLSSPRFLLGSALELLRPYAPQFKGIDVLALLAFIERCQACIPPGLETGQGRVAAEEIPTLTL